MLPVLSLKESDSINCHLDTNYNHLRERPSIQELPRSDWLVGVPVGDLTDVGGYTSSWMTSPKQTISCCISKSAKHEPRMEPESESPSSVASWLLLQVLTLMALQDTLSPAV